MSDIDYTKYKLKNEKTPCLEQLTAHYKKSYAFYTMSERVPTILTHIVDQLNREKDEIVERFGEQSREELKTCIGEISKLKYEIQTDKKMTEIPNDDSDQFEWNRLLRSIDRNCSYFSATWLYAECYVYRRLRSIFDETQWLKSFDYFESSKKKELANWIPIAAQVIRSVNEFNASGPAREQIGDFFRKLLKVNLWGNKNDLSVTLGKEVKSNSRDPVAEVELFDKELLVDQTDDIWKCLISAKGDEIMVDIINDNSGYELLCDLILADFIITHNLAKKVRFRVKAIPWFISDVVPADFRYTLNELKNHEIEEIRNIGNRYNELLESGRFELVEPPDFFFTSPFEYYKMEKIAPALYRSIADAHLAIFKGDLNYRKLLADINWDPTVDFRTSLSGFEPTNLCSLRTIKADLVSGLKPGVAEDLDEREGASWMATGKYGVIQFIDKKIYTQ